MYFKIKTSPNPKYLEVCQQRLHGTNYIYLMTTAGHLFSTKNNSRQWSFWRASFFPAELPRISTTTNHNTHYIINFQSAEPWLTKICVLIISGNLAKLNECPHYPDPRNGRMICDHLIGKYCAPECHAGFQLASTPAWAYMCNSNSKRWVTYPENYPLPWPDCVRETK